MAGKGSAPGERRGGRQKGSRNKATVVRQEQVAASGKTPLDVMLDNMRFADGQATELLAKFMGLEPGATEGVELLKQVFQVRQVAQDYAKDAAPYVHPKLAAREADRGDGAREVNPRPAPVIEHDPLYRQVLAWEKPTVAVGK